MNQYCSQFYNDLIEVDVTAVGNHVSMLEFDDDGGFELFQKIMHVSYHMQQRITEEDLGTN